MSENNPYQPPVPATATVAGAGNFDAGGRTVDAGHAWTWITSAFSMFMKQPGMWVLLFIIYFACCVLLGMVPILGGFANLLLLPVFGAGFMQACRVLDEGGEVAVEHLFFGFKNKTGDLMFIGAFACAPLVVVIVGMLIAGGAGIFAALFSGTAALATLGVSVALAMLAGMIVSVPVYMALWFAAPLVLFDGVAPGAALKASFSACLKNVIAFTLYAIVLAVLFVAGSIPFGLGLIVVLPVTLISVYTAYREIFFGA
jgi:uncharacterized membrane protein